MKKIAIVGAGFSGLALCYHLFQEESEKEIVLFDGKGIGGGASGIASGLLHPFPGERANLSWRGREGMAAALELLGVVGEEVYKRSGILRLALNEKQVKAFAARAAEEEDVEWWSAEKCRAYIPGGHFVPGIFIHSGVTVHAALYLKGLWGICEGFGATLEKRHVQLEDLEGFDQVVLAAGAGMGAFDVGMSLKMNKGQVLVCKKPSYWTSESSLIGKGYLALSEDPQKCYLGSTYERDFITEAPCLGTATHLILNQVGQFLPLHSGLEVEGCVSAMRAVSQKSYHPIMGEIKPGLFVLTGMGSRGLLYHAYLGSLLARQMSQESMQLEEVK